MDSIEIAFTEVALALDSTVRSLSVAITAAIAFLESKPNPIFDQVTSTDLDHWRETLAIKQQALKFLNYYCELDAQLLRVFHLEFHTLP